MKVTLVPHTHWDREWYEPFSVFSERLVGMMDTLLDLAADGFPHFHLDGQTAMIDDYLERRPERADELAARVREGRLSAGPWVTQMDEFLVSGESHVRNLRMGLERARELGAEPRVGYLPDQFGHVGQMPRILREAGLEWALVWRGVPAAIDRATFRWRSTDGSAEVFCEYMPFGYSAGARLMEADEPESLAAAIRAEIERMRPFLVDDRLLLMVGYDHAGPDATLPERLERAAPLLPGIEARIGGIDVHVEGRELGDLPVWTGELRSSARAHLLPNVVSARVHQKLERGRVETLLERHVESGSAPEDELRRAWTLMLWNGAHDSACGCSHDQVAVDVDARFAEARTIAERILDRAASAPSSEDVPSEVTVVPLPEGIEVDGVSLRFFDEPDVGDLYTFCFAEEGQRPSPPGRVEVEGDRFEVVWGGLRVSARAIRIDGAASLLVLEGKIHNERPDHRLRLHITLPRRAETAFAGAPFELVRRPLIGEGSAAEAPSPTWPARHAVLASGTAVLHEGVFEYEVVDGTSLAVTLLRCVGSISREKLATRPYPAGPTTPTPNAQMLGSTELRLGIWAAADETTLLERWDLFALAHARRAVGGPTASASCTEGA